MSTDNMYARPHVFGKHQFEVISTALDGTDTTGNKVAIVPLPPSLGTILVKEVGLIYTNAAGSGSITSGGVFQLKNGSTVVGEITVETGKAQGESTLVDCDTTPHNYSPTGYYVVPAAFPEIDLEGGEFLSVDLKTQGVGGTQNCQMYFLYSVAPKANL